MFHSLLRPQLTILLETFRLIDLKLTPHSCCLILGANSPGKTFDDSKLNSRWQFKWQTKHEFHRNSLTKQIWMTQNSSERFLKWFKMIQNVSFIVEPRYYSCLHLLTKVFYFFFLILFISFCFICLPKKKKKNTNRNNSICNICNRLFIFCCCCWRGLLYYNFNNFNNFNSVKSMLSSPHCLTF